MRRYVKIEDIRETRSWRHHPSARLYMYLCMTCDYTSGEWHGTRRRTALEVGLTDQEYRTALANLQRDGLIEIANPTSNPTSNPKSTQRATQVRVVIIKELGGGTSPKEQPNMQPNGQPNGQPSNNYYYFKKKYTLTRAREILPTVRDAVMAYCSLDTQQATAAVRAFFVQQGKSGKTWIDEEDFRLHCCSWCLHHYADAKTSLQAENKAEERQERVAKQLDAAAQAAKDEQALREKVGYLEYVVKMPSVAEVVKTMYEQGFYYDDHVRELVEQLYIQKPGLRDEVTASLGFDILSVTIKNIK